MKLPDLFGSISRPSSNKFNSYFPSHHMQVCDISGLSFLNTLASIIFPTGNACVPADESPPCADSSADASTDALAIVNNSCIKFMTRLIFLPHTPIYTNSNSLGQLNSKPLQSQLPATIIAHFNLAGLPGGESGWKKISVAELVYRNWAWYHPLHKQTLFLVASLIAPILTFYLLPPYAKCYPTQP